MQELKVLLDNYGVDTSSLDLLFDTGEEQILSLKIKGDESIAYWRLLRQLFDETRYWPVIIGEDKNIQIHLNTIESLEPRSTSEIIKRGITWNLEGWLDHIKTLYPLEQGSGPTEIYHPLEERQVFDIYPEQIYIALAPVDNPWAIPAVFRFGFHNDCPSPPEQICMLKHWYEHYKAEVMELRTDQIKFQVLHPPLNYESAISLVWQQLAYCSEGLEGIDENVNIESLAMALIGQREWFFWWD